MNVRIFASLRKYIAFIDMHDGNRVLSVTIRIMASNNISKIWRE